MIRPLPALRRLLIRLTVVVALLVLLPYAWAPVYDFPAPIPFSGSQLWNPYASAQGHWKRANFHAHGRAWFGLTSGAQPGSEVVRHYHQLGYDVAGVSDYQHIAAFNGVNTPPVYEHGFNIGKSHQLAIGAHAVEWFDLPLWQSHSNQQYIIDRVHAKSDLVALNHPNTRDAYNEQTVRTVTGFDLIEVANGPFTDEGAWDAALSSGRPVWSVGNDDTHDIEDTRRTAAAWTMIDALTPEIGDIVEALRNGRSYTVLRTGAVGSANATRLSSLVVENRTMTVTLDGSPSTMSFIGVDGTVRLVVRDATTASYSFTDADPYVRVVVTTPQAMLFLNPVIRWDGARLPRPVATVNAALTWTQRGAAVLLFGILLARLWPRRGHARSAAPSPAIPEA